MKRLVTAMIAAVVTLVATSCGSDPAPSTTLGSGSEVDRSSAEATAVAFANIYATGDVPAACQLANDAGKEGIGKSCTQPQPWSTTVTLGKNCEVKASAVSASAWSYSFDAPVGSLDRESGIRVEVERAPGETMWWVRSVLNRYHSPGQPVISTCLSDQTTAPTGPSSTGG